MVTATPGPATFVQLESSAPVVDVLYRAGQVAGAASGAYGANVKAPRNAWFLEEQRAGSVDLYDGVVRDDPALITEGLRLFHYGLARQAPNGSFPGSAWPFHGTALFLAEAAPSLIFLQQSSYAAQFQSTMTWDIGRMHLAARYMVHTVGGPGRIDDHTKNHRWFEAALALGATGILSGDRALINWSHVYARQGVRMQRPDGVMPENGGHDSGYQAVGLSYAIQYIALLASGALRSSLLKAVTKGEAWELSRINANGSVNQTGDRRTVNCQERSPAGDCKSVFITPIAGALARWATLSGNKQYARISRLVQAPATGSRPPTIVHTVPGPAPLPAGALGSVHSILRGLGVQPPQHGRMMGRLQMPLFTQYELSTQRLQRASVQFRDATVLYLNQQTVATLQTPLKTKLRSGEIDQVDGHGVHHVIETPNSTTSAIGTNFDVRYDGTETFVIVVKGTVQVADAAGSQTVNANQESTVTGQAAPTAPVPVDASAATAWDSELQVWQGLPGTYQAFGLAASPDGTVLVGQWSGSVGHGTITGISGAGKQLFSWPFTAHLDGQGYYSASLAVDDQGHVFILDGSGRVQEFSPAGNRVQTWDIQTRPEFDQNIAVDHNGNVYIIAYRDTYCVSRIQKYSPDGTKLSDLNPGPGDRYLCWAIALAAGPDGYLYDVNTERRIWKFDTNGAEIAQIGPAGNGNQMDWHIAIDKTGDVFESFDERDQNGSSPVRELRTDGTIVGVWKGAQLAVPGDTSPPLAGQLAIDPQGSVYMFDPANRRIKKLAP